MIEPPLVLLWGVGTIFLASVVSGLTSFGFALVAVPLLMIFLPPKVVVPTVLMLSVSGSVVVLFETKKWIDLKRIWPLIIAGVAASPLGAYLLLIMDVDTLKMLIGVVIVISALALFTGLRLRIKNEKLAFVLVGFASGLLAGSTAMGGPPTILFFSNQRAEKQVFRANLNIFFAVLGLSSILSQLIGGLVTTDALTCYAWFLPVLLVGILLGIKLAHSVSETTFRKATLVVVAISGLSAIASGLGLF
jgi:uncharacterized membrane protein YfcA